MNEVDAEYEILLSLKNSCLLERIFSCLHHLPTGH